MAVYIKELRRQAYSFQEKGQYAKAVSLLTRVVSQDPDSCDDWYMLGFCYEMLWIEDRQLSNLEAAQTSYLNAIILEYTYEEAWERLSGVLKELGKNSESAAAEDGALYGTIDTEVRRYIAGFESLFGISIDWENVKDRFLPDWTPLISIRETYGEVGIAILVKRLIWNVIRKSDLRMKSEPAKSLVSFLELYENTSKPMIENLECSDGLFLIVLEIIAERMKESKERCSEACSYYSEQLEEFKERISVDTLRDGVAPDFHRWKLEAEKAAEFWGFEEDDDTVFIVESDSKSVEQKIPPGGKYAPKVEVTRTLVNWHCSWCNCGYSLEQVETLRTGRAVECTACGSVASVEIGRITSA